MKKTALLLLGVVLVVAIVVLSYVFLVEKDDVTVNTEVNEVKNDELSDSTKVTTDKGIMNDAEKVVAVLPDFEHEETDLKIYLPENWTVDLKDSIKMETVELKDENTWRFVYNFLDSAGNESLIFFFTAYPVDTEMAVLDMQLNTEVVALNDEYILTSSQALDMSFEIGSEDFNKFTLLFADLPTILDDVELGDNGFAVNTVISEKNDTLNWEVSVNYPVFKGEADFEKVNKLIEDQINETVKAFTDNILDWESDSIAVEQNISTLWINYSVEYLTEKFVSIKFVSSTYFAGAAHPNTFSSSINYDMANSMVAELSYLFMGDEADYLAELSTLIKEKLKVQMKDDPFPLYEEGLEPKIENFSNFSILEDGVMFNFPPYQLAPYAAGEFNVFLNSEELGFSV